MKLSAVPVPPPRVGSTATAGAVASTVTEAVPGEPALPAASVAVADTVVVPSNGMSALPKLALQVPAAVAVAVRVTLPQKTLTVLPGSAEPVMVTPAVFSAALTTLSMATGASMGAIGAVVSMLVTAGALKLPWLPPAPSTTAVKRCSPWASGADGMKLQVDPLTSAVPSAMLPS